MPGRVAEFFVWIQRRAGHTVVAVHFRPHVGRSLRRPTGPACARACPEPASETTLPPSPDIVRFWGVNRNQTFAKETAGGYLWSPKRSKNSAQDVKRPRARVRTRELRSLDKCVSWGGVADHLGARAEPLRNLRNIGAGNLIVRAASRARYQDFVNSQLERTAPEFGGFPDLAALTLRI
jgi:hypothetical protein